MPNRVSHPRGAESGVMRAAIGKNLMPDGVVLEKQDHLAGHLNDLHREGMKKNPRQAGWGTAAVDGVVRFREGIGVSSERGPGSLVLCLAPGGHRRFLKVQLIKPVAFHNSGRPGTVLHPNP